MDVLDEPLYANFLKVTGADRPYRDEVLSKMVCSSEILCIVKLISSYIFFVVVSCTACPK